jgi:hypothetical protein
LERVSTLRYSVVPRIFERGYPVVEVTRGKRSGVVANVSAIGCIGVVIVATRVDERGSRAVDVSAWTDPLRPDPPNP